MVSAEGVEQVGTRTDVRGDYVYAFVVAVADSMAFSNVPSLRASRRLWPFHVGETDSQDEVRGNRRGAHIVGSIRAVVLGRIEAHVEFVWTLSFPVHFFFL